MSVKRLGADGSLAGVHWGGHQTLHLVTNYFAALLSLARLPPLLVSPRGHYALLTRHRTRFVAERLGAALLFLSFATILWIPIDVVLFNFDWRVVIPLAVGRLITSILFLIIANLELRGDRRRHCVQAITLMILVGVGFFLFAHAVIATVGNDHLSSAGHLQYLFMPIALAAGIAIFPLTLAEAVLLSIWPLLALVIELVHDGHFVWAETSIAILLMVAIAVTTVTCAVSQLKLLVDLHQHATTDPLTGALSRGAGNELMGVLFTASDISKTPLSVVFFDLDYFKSVNDQFGHDAGDRVLQNVAAKVKGRLRKQDALIRWGGEEFVLLLPGADSASATRIVSDLSRSGLSVRSDGSLQTVSVGLSERILDGADCWQRLVEIADSRMYMAKNQGRDRLIGPGLVSHRLVGALSSVA